MDQDNRELLISDAKHLWQSGSGDKAIDRLYETVPLEKRAEWLRGILLSVRGVIAESKSIDRIIKLTETEQEIDWDEHRPHPILYAIDDEGRQLQGIPHHVHNLAYYVGKQVVNVKGYGAPFDHSNLFLVPEEMKHIALLTQDETVFMSSMWKVLSDERFIQLENPVMCNPNCILCMMRFGKLPLT